MKTPRTEAVVRMAIGPMREYAIIDHAQNLERENIMLREALEKYVKAMDAIYNHNAAARAAVIQHFGLRHHTANIQDHPLPPVSGATPTK